MEEKYVLIEYESSIKDVLTQTFQSLQRIKLTCFDISNNYIVFGASSGGIYIFNREPCQFVKLIPSKEGSATNILISPDEKKIAISSSKGLVIILDNILEVNYEVYSEHEGQHITALKWHNTDLFCGDHSGKISVITVNNILAKAIFQSSSASLMHLDSEIVQIDCHSKFLLVTTQTRAYFCDTERQQYRQIGKKLRDGPFGGCFFNIPSNDDLVMSTQNSHLFQSIRDDESFSSMNTDVKIYCSRPGARLWEVNFEAVVLQTHQFRSSLSKCPSDIIYLTEKTDTRLKISKFDLPKTVADDFAFGKLLNVFNKFILTFDKNGIYVFDVTISELLFWTNSLKNIRDVKIVNCSLYIWRDSQQINVLSILELETLVLKSLYQKQYYLCVELCLYFTTEIDSLINNSNKLYLLTSLKSKLEDLNERELLDKIEPLLNKIIDANNYKLKTKKLTNGIVVIDNVYANIPESVQSFEPATSKVETSSKDENIQVYTMYKQYRLHETHKNIDIPDFCKLFESDCILSTIHRFVEYAKDEHNLNVISWCQEQALRQVSRRELNIYQYSDDFILYLKTAFVDINKRDSLELICKCGFPLPKVHNRRPKYYKIGSILLNTDNIETYIKTIPYMYKKKLEHFQDINEVLKNICLLLQFSDVDIFKLYLSKITYDIWDEAVKHFIRLKKGNCLNCDNKIDVTSCFSWSDLGLLIVQSIGAQNSTKLLKRYSQFIPNGELNAKFYQACIFVSVANIKPKYKKNGVNFIEEILNSNSSCQFEKQMEDYLNNKYLGKFTDPVSNTSRSLPNCSYCSLPMNTPMINDPSRLPCGHIYHRLCLTHNNNICHICNSNLV